MWQRLELRAQLAIALAAIFLVLAGVLAKIGAVGMPGTGIGWLLAAVAGAAVLTGASIYFLTRPLGALAEAAGRFASGDADAAVAESLGSSEASETARALRAMNETMRGLEARLAVLNAGVDRRVAERAAEAARAHAALISQGERLRTVIETAMDGIMILDEVGKIETFNSACERIFGWKSAEVVGRPVTELTADEVRRVRGGQLVFENLADPLPAAGPAAGNVHTVRGVRRDGTSFPLEVSLSRATIDSASVYVAIVRDVTEAVRAREQLFGLATSDALTGMRNRRYFLEGAEAEFSRAKRHSRNLSLLLIDVDHFKEINDTHGHAAGDAALKSLARVCRRSMREVDIVGRIGGEEFAIAMPEAELASARAAAERLRRQIAEEELSFDGKAIRITISVGVSAAEPRDMSIEQIMRRADQALYQAKGGGRNRVVVASSVGRADG